MVIPRVKGGTGTSGTGKCGFTGRWHSTGGQGDLVMTSADEEYRTGQQVCLPYIQAGRPANPKQRKSYCFFNSDTNP
jgi:hypothetical protein